MSQKTEAKLIPLCHKCASAVVEGTDGTHVLTGCLENDTIKSYKDAETKCPWLGEPDEDGCTRKMMVEIPMDFPYVQFMELYERGIRELPKETIVAAYCEMALTEQLERTIHDGDKEESDRPTP